MIRFQITSVFFLLHPQNIDTLLRCPICFDFLNISMMTKCSHNFCSLCIRKFLSYKLQCPVCNMVSKNDRTRPEQHRLLDDLVTNFRTARQQLSKANFDSPPISPKTPSLLHFFQKKLKTPPSENTGLDRSIAHSFQPRKMELSHNPKLPSEKTRVPVKEEALDVQIAHSSSPSIDVKPIIKVECPVCSVSISQQFINKHLDTCLTRDEKKESLRSSLGNNRRPMGKLVYNLLSVQELKRRLKECHLSMQGSRDQLIKRHQAFVQSYNAQCDSLNPKSGERGCQVEANEKARNQLQGKPNLYVYLMIQSYVFFLSMFDYKYLQQNHSSDFSRLIAQVRGRIESSKRKQEGQRTARPPPTHSVAELMLNALIRGRLCLHVYHGRELPGGAASPAECRIKFVIKMWERVIKLERGFWAHPAVRKEQITV
uniref:RING-type E3 ubiquitin transferase n=1 Tax=Gouania willdenowi TaxID=441366 RepID=A0A8C5ESY1_GOUWI